MGKFYLSEEQQPQNWIDTEELSIVACYQIPN